MRLLAALLLSFCVNASASASEFDINYLFTPSASGSIEPSAMGRGQTFQMGKSGSLDQIIVTAGYFNSGQATATLKLYDLVGIETNGSPLTLIATSTTVISDYSIQANRTFNFQNLNFPAGKKLAFALFGHISISIGLGGAGPPNSTPIVVSNDSIFFTSRTASFATMITLVPEPTTLSLALVSTIGLFRRRPTLSHSRRFA